MLTLTRDVGQSLIFRSATVDARLLYCGMVSLGQYELEFWDHGRIVLQFGLPRGQEVTLYIGAVPIRLFNDNTCLERRLRLGISAPADVVVLRGELLEKVA